jgi:hypothetical protein
MPRGLSLKKKKPKEEAPSPLKDDGQFVIQQDAPGDEFSVAELAKKYFRSPGYPPHFTRTEIKQPLLKSTPDDLKGVSSNHGCCTAGETKLDEMRLSSRCPIPVCNNNSQALNR